MRRPLIQVVLPFVGGILAGTWISVPLPWLLAINGGLVALAMCWGRQRSLILLLAMFGAGWTDHAVHTQILSPNDLRKLLGDQAELVCIRGRLRETPNLRIYEQDPEPAWRSLAEIEVQAIRRDRQEWQPATGRIMTGTRGLLTNFFAGQVVEVSGVAAPPRIAVAEGTFDYRAFLKEKGIYFNLAVTSELDWQVVTSPPRPPLSDRFRAWAQPALALGLPCEDESLRLEWALTLGWKTALTQEVCEPFVQAATYHIFAVDGLRMAIVFGIFFGLFRALNMPRPVAGIVLVPLIWFYVALTGWPASAIRATVMLTLVILSWSLNRPTDLLNSLYAAALLILVWQPQQLYQAGFQLSFLVVWCMILILPPLRASITRLVAPDPLLPPQLHRRWPPYLALPARYLTDLNLTSFAAWAGSIPLVAYYFNIVTPVSTPANVLAVPLCALVLITNLASLMLVAWFPGAAELFNHAGWFLMELIRVSSEWFARWPAAYWYVPAPSYLGIALYYVLVLGFAGGWLFNRQWWRVKLAIAAPVVLAWGWFAWQDYCLTRFTFLPLNGGTAILCDYPGFRDDLLIDCGNTNAVTFTAKGFLRSQGVNHLPRFALTHGDLRHIGGAGMIADTFSPGEICVSSNRFRSATYRQHLQAFEATPSLVRHVSFGDTVGRWQVLHPAATNRFSRADDQALVLLDRFQGTRILLLSDLGHLGQEALLTRLPDLRADIVISGLPTVDEPLCDQLLESLRPQAIIITDSEFPASERAAAPLMTRLAKAGIPVVSTRSAGATTLEFRGRRWAIRSMNGTVVSSRSLTSRR